MQDNKIQGLKNKNKGCPSVCVFVSPCLCVSIGSHIKMMDFFHTLLVGPAHLSLSCTEIALTSGPKVIMGSASYFMTKKVRVERCDVMPYFCHVTL